jgi:hypothetical protein
MKHKPKRLDVITDLRRSIMSSYSKNGFEDSNFKIFLGNAEANLSKIELDKNTYDLTLKRLNKAKNPKQSIEKRREDLLMASILVL